MPLPYGFIAEGDAIVATQWGKLQTAVTVAVSWRATVATDTATVATKQSAYDAALAAWIADGSPGSGATFDAKVAAAIELGIAQDNLVSSTAQLATFSGDTPDALMYERKAFARAVAQYALILGEAPNYRPTTSPARLFDLIYQVAFGIAPTF